MISFLYVALAFVTGPQQARLAALLVLREKQEASLERHSLLPLARPEKKQFI